MSDDSCYFCGCDVAPADQLRYELALEAWQESRDAQTIVGDIAFAAQPQLTCKSCRRGIEQNQAELTEEAAENQTFYVWLILGVGIAGIVAMVCTMRLLKTSKSLINPTPVRSRAYASGYLPQIHWRIGDGRYIQSRKSA